VYISVLSMLDCYHVVYMFLYIFSRRRAYSLIRICLCSLAATYINKSLCEEKVKTQKHDSIIVPRANQNSVGVRRRLRLDIFRSDRIVKLLKAN
jgi:hypothetical protein